MASWTTRRTVGSRNVGSRRWTRWAPTFRWCLRQIASTRDSAITARIAAECNDEVAEIVLSHPSRFMGLGTLPMQDVKRAIGEMERGMLELGLKGFMINDYVNQLTYDDEVFEDFWAAAVGRPLISLDPSPKRAALNPTRDDQIRVSAMKPIKHVVRQEDVQWRKNDDPRDDLNFRRLIWEEMGSTKLCVGVGELPPGRHLGLHHHEDDDEFYYVMGGKAKVTVDGEEIDAYPGTAIFMPARSKHKIINDGKEKFVFVYGLNAPTRRYTWDEPIKK